MLLQSDLTVTQDGDVAPRENVAPGSEAAGPRGKATSDSGQAQPVFRSQSGTLMTLPGGVLLALDETWEQPAVDAFFAYNGINLDRVSELDYLTNGFFVETEPGFPSLELAKRPGRAGWGAGIQPQLVEGSCGQVGRGMWGNSDRAVSFRQRPLSVTR